MTYKVYCIEHLDTGMKYIGITGDELRIRWRQHYNDPNSAVYKVLRRDGHRMTMTVLEEVTTKDHALRLEQEYIRDMNTAEPHGWNRKVRTLPKKKRIWKRVQCEISFNAEDGIDLTHLLCPTCGHDYIHFRTAKTFGPYEGHRFNYGGVILYFWCEYCHAPDFINGEFVDNDDVQPDFEILYGSHKGRTFFEVYKHCEVTS
jgi:predicted GIY-YIG superfamily endonuclease